MLVQMRAGESALEGMDEKRAVRYEAANEVSRIVRNAESTATYM
jgi:hypothetical protein